MRRVAIHCVALWAALGAFGSAFAAGPQGSSDSLKCEAGPVSKIFGGTKWLVYGCADGRSVVVVSAPGNPATPFYFMLSPGQRGYEVVGEGAGQKEATAAAYAELKALTESQVKALVAEAGRARE
jgi:hypothetical protein